jgi:hypothetical protein
MNPTRATLLLASALVSLAAAAGGCNLILGTGYTVGELDGSAAPQDDAPQGKGDSPVPGADAADGSSGQADACPSNPQDKSQLESACTNASCQPFDNASRNPRCAEGGTACPPLPTPEAGAGAPEAGAPDAGSPGGDA